MKRLNVSPALVVLGFLSMALAGSQAHGQPCADFALTGGVNFWPRGRIPYVFSSSFPEASKPTFREATKDWMKSGGAVAFVEYSSYSGGPYILVETSQGGGNDSLLGPRIPTLMHINPNLGINARSHVVHELGHAIGYPHEQARPDRDAYVHVQTNNITSGQYYINNFAVVSWECWPPRAILTPYDYGSIMHYDWCLGSTVGCGSGTKGVTDTMFAVNTSVQYTMGDWIGNDGASMSELDKQRIQRVYGKAIWVDVNGPCLFENGGFNCDFPAVAGPYKSIAGAVAAVPSFSDPSTTLMIKTGTYPHNESQTLRLDKPMKLVAWEYAVRIE